MKILIVKNRALGDSIMGLSTIQYVRTLFPKSEIVYAIPSWIIPLYKNTVTEVDRYISCDLQKIGDWIEFFNLLLDENFNSIFELHQAGRTSKILSFFSKLTGTPYLFHNHHLKSSSVHDQGVIKPLIQRDLDGVWTFFSKNSTPPKYLDYTPSIKVQAVNNLRVIFGIVATRETKMWPISYFASLAKRIKEMSPLVEIIVPISSSIIDKRLAHDLAESCDVDLKIISVPLEVLPKLFAGSTLYIGNDTGLKHLAVAVSIPSLTIFGPEPPNEWHPYDNSFHKVCYKEDLSCRTEKYHYCGLSKCDHLSCMKEITVDFVWEKVQKLI